MNVVLDSGALSRLASSWRLQGHAARRAEITYLVPATVLIESLSGDHRRDHHPNRFVGHCEVVPLDEPTARLAALLRFRVAGTATPSPVDASVVATAITAQAAVVLTGDVDDLTALAGVSPVPVRIEGI